MFVVLLLFYFLLRPTNVFIQIEKSCAQIVAIVGFQGSARLLSWVEGRAVLTGTSVRFFSLCCVPSP